MTNIIGSYGLDPSATGITPSTTTSMSALGGLDSEGFLKLLIAQLRFQSPLEPSDPTQLMMQTSQLAQLDAVQQLADLQRRDLGLQQAVAAASLLGTEIHAVGDNGAIVQGTVDKVRYTAAGPVLGIGDKEVSLGAVLELHRAESTET